MMFESGGSEVRVVGKHDMGSVRPANTPDLSGFTRLHLILRLTPVLPVQCFSETSKENHYCQDQCAIIPLANFSVFFVAFMQLSNVH